MPRFLFSLTAFELGVYFLLLTNIVNGFGGSPLVFKPLLGATSSTSISTPRPCVAHARGSTRLYGSREEIRGKIKNAKHKLRTAIAGGNDDQVERLKALIMHLRQQDPEFRTEDAMYEALDQGMFSKAAKLKLKLNEIKQNPFRVLPEDQDEDGDVSEDMTWGYDQTFHDEGNGSASTDDENGDPDWSDI
ncbi:unnamed protein product [Discosporangium mesarthrocarpum]